MRAPAWLVAVVVIGLAAVCVRLGFWQISRLHEKQALNASIRAALAGPALPFPQASVPAESLVGHRVQTRGRFDERTQVLLSGRSRDGSPGVEVVTPLDLGGNRAVLVDRGWLSSGDATWARPQDSPDQGERSVVGIAEPLRSSGALGPVVVRDADGTRLLSMRRLVRDSLEARFPYDLADIVIRELPGPGVPQKPARAAPRPADETMHLSYAAQWFLFAAILLVGPLVVAANRRRSRP